MSLHRTLSFVAVLCLLGVKAQIDIRDGPYVFTRQDVRPGERETRAALPFFNGSLGTLKRVEWTASVQAAFPEGEDTQIWSNQHPADCVPATAEGSLAECTDRTGGSPTTTCTTAAIDDCRPLVICGTGANYRNWIFLPSDVIYGTEQPERINANGNGVTFGIDEGYIFGGVTLRGGAQDCPPSAAFINGNQACLDAIDEAGFSVAEVIDTTSCSTVVDTQSMRRLRAAGCFPGRCVVQVNNPQANRFSFDPLPAQTKNVTVRNATLLRNYYHPGPGGAVDARVRGERGLQIGFNDQEGSSAASNPTADPGPTGFDPDVEFTVTVTYFYDEFATLIVRQRTTDNSAIPRFNFTTDFVTDATGAGSLPDCSLLHPEECVRDGLDAGTYTVTQVSAPDEYELVDVQCVVDGGAPMPRLNQDTFIDVVLPPATTTICTFTNQPKERVTFRKVQCDSAFAVFSFNVDFSFPQDPVCPFSANGCTPVRIAGGASSTALISTPTTPNAVNTVTITEVNADPGYFTMVSCDVNATTATSSNSPTPRAVLSLRQGSPDVLCTFTNIPTITLELVQQIIPDGDDGVFTFNASGIDAFNPTQLGDDDMNTTIAVPPCVGSERVKVTQMPLLGYDLTAVVCDGNAVDIPNAMGFYDLSSVALGRTLRCAFINTRRAALKVTVLTMPPTMGGDPVLSFTGTLVDTLSHTGMNTVENLLPNAQYNVTGGADPVGWELTSINCTDSMTGIDSFAVDRTAIFNLEPGELAECTFILTELAPTRVIYQKVTVPAGLPDSFEFTFNSSTLRLTDGQRGMHTVLPGTYTVAETLPNAGFVLTDITCNDSATPGAATESSGNASSGVATYVVGIEEVTECVFTNTKLARITIIKRLNEDLPEVNFTFTVDDQTFFLTQNESFSYTVPRVPDTTVTVFEDLLTLNNNPGGVEYTLDRIECVDRDDVTVDIDPENRTRGGAVTVPLTAGADVTCIFFNNASSTGPCPESLVPKTVQRTTCCAGDTAQDMCSQQGLFEAETIPASYVLGSSQGPNLNGVDLSGIQIGSDPASVLQIGTPQCNNNIPANHFTTGFFGFVAVAFKDPINGELVAVVENQGESSSGVSVRAMGRQSDNSSATNTFLDFGVRTVNPQNRGLQKLTWALSPALGVCIDTVILEVAGQDLSGAPTSHFGVHINSIYGTLGCQCPSDPLCPPPVVECYEEFQRTWVMPPTGQMTLGQLGLKFRKCYTPSNPPPGTTLP